ncbi:GNAT family protein [Undibacterium cyanobacteriorum]|uniref:GNAT family protein n=1 Tax=Undibacterium cyanobacteriorum TaxID=3073561 RepID=A0ABY9RH98_9BURK|nr:GNAT family protein [Undibacterium sp. 20NA77.5]WMW80585.1 GNAT family protein [Undibacterium sp. 20NA77.5]
MSDSHLRLSVVSLANAPELLEFELANRTFFEQRINARPPEFYSEAGVASAIQAALHQARQDLAYQYLIWYGEDLVGRVNLTQVRRQHFHSAALGYRIGEVYNGRGFAKQAVQLALRKAFEVHQLLRVEACARPENLASIKVMLANGFVQYGHSKRSFELHGEWFDTVHFEVHKT